jgi:hypothetical protein
MAIVAATHAGQEFISIGLGFALKPSSSCEVMAAGQTDSA